MSSPTPTPRPTPSARSSPIPATSLRQHKKDVEEAISRGAKKNLTVVDNGGGGFTVTMNIHPDRAAKGTSVPEHDQSDVTALRDEVQGILKKATESDTSASKVLTAIANQSTMGFSDASYKDRDSAVEAVQAAEDLAKIAAKNPEDLTAADFDKINNGLDKYKNDPLFAERFATQLGPKKTLEFWQGINDPAVNPHVGRERLDKLDDLQRNLGLTLAAATQSDSADMTSWKGNMIKLGEQPIGRDGGGPMGFQVMSNLMRTGDYDDQFLKSYGNKLMETERKLTGNGEHENMAWQHRGPDPWLNRIGEDSGDDPLTGYLKGLSNSPDAATDFFNQEYVSKEDSPSSAIRTATARTGRSRSPTSSTSSRSGSGRRRPTSRATTTTPAATLSPSLWRPPRPGTRRASCRRWTLRPTTRGRPSSSSRSWPPSRTTTNGSPSTTT